MASLQDKIYMKQATELAKRGAGFVNPNPLVGAVIVKDGKVIGQGWHAKYGQLHAERNAFASLENQEDAEGATIYVTLEPCCHYGKTPPCTEAIIEHGIKRVVIGSADPNPLVSGKGEQILRSQGIDVESGVLREECDKLNNIFFHYITTKTPYVIMKYAMTADGKIACYTGDSRWITNEKSRLDTHFLRKRCASIMVGIGTVLADNPMLNCRTENPSNPTRIVCDSNLRIPTDCKLVQTAKEIPLIVATVSEDIQKIKQLEQMGVTVLKTTAENSRVNLKELMKKLGEMKIDSLILEGGSELNYSALKSGIVSEVQVYIGNKIFGGAGAKTAVGGTGIAKVAEAVELSVPEAEVLDGDVKLTYRVLSN